MRNFSDSRIYEKEQMMKQKQKITNFFNKIKESKAIECLKQ